MRAVPVLISAVALFGTNVQASDYHSPRTAALGGAGHASPLLTDAIYLNPAMGAFLQAYSVSASIDKFHGPDKAEPNGRVEHLSAQDGTNPAFQAGAGYTRDPYGRLISVGVSSKVAQQYAVGVGAKFLFGSDSQQSAQDVMVSSIGQPLPWLQTGITADNLIQSTNVKNWGRYREFTLGLKANIEKLMFIYADPHVIPDKPGTTAGFEAGVEIPIMTDFFLRGGFNSNSFQPQIETYGKGYGFGVGWIFPRLSLDFAVEKTKTPIESTGYLFSLTMVL